MVRGPPPSLIHSVFPPSVSSLPSKVQVLYGGTDLFDYEVRRTFNNDMLLAFISSSCIAALVYILTSCSGMVLQWPRMEPAPSFLPGCFSLDKAFLLRNAGNGLESAVSELAVGQLLRHHLLTLGRETEAQRQIEPCPRARSPRTSYS